MTSPAPAATGRARSTSPHAKEYETIYILRADVDAESAERIQARVADALEREHGKLVKVETWGRRKLAYSVRKQRKGVYVYIKYVGGGGLVAEVERNLKLQDAVVKFMTVQTSDEVDLAALQIDPEEIKLGKIELPAEDEKEESREKLLGLVDLGPEAPKPPRAEEGEDFESDEGEETAVSKDEPEET
ncbi:MAG: 30S ribosomal protein S6 [Polyangiaceae bacterium]|nr:30S ribosomal protein S6 [Polyangiaceae bacterium]